jgi:hypothetical protein
MKLNIDHEAVRVKREAYRKKQAVSNRKRLKADTVKAIDQLLSVIGSIHNDAVEGLTFGEVTLSINDLAKLKSEADKLAYAFSLERGNIR